MKKGIISLYPYVKQQKTHLLVGPVWWAYLASSVIGGDDPASSSVVTRCYGRFFPGIWKIPQGENEHKISLRTAREEAYMNMTSTMGGLKMAQF